MDLRVEKYRMIRVISVYCVSQSSPAEAGELTSYKQQDWSMLKLGINNLNPKKAFLTDLSKFIRQWKKEDKRHEIIIMTDMNKCISTNGDLADFFPQNDLIDTIGTMNPDLLLENTYLYGIKRIDYICISSTISHMVVKVGHRQFDQHFVSDHKGIYVQFMATDLFDNHEIDKSH